jgi:hypothetical protein
MKGIPKEIKMTKEWHILSFQYANFFLEKNKTHKKQLKPLKNLSCIIRWVWPDLLTIKFVSNL